GSSVCENWPNVVTIACSRGAIWWIELKPSHTSTIAPTATGNSDRPPGPFGRRKLPPGPPRRRFGPSGPRCLNKSSIFAERRPRSSEPPPGSQGLRGPRDLSSPVGGVDSGSAPGFPSPDSLSPDGLPQGLRLPAI